MAEDKHAGLLLRRLSQLSKTPDTILFIIWLQIMSVSAGPKTKYHTKPDELPAKNEPSTSSLPQGLGSQHA